MRRVPNRVVRWAALVTLLLSLAPTATRSQQSAMIRERLKTRPDDPALYFYLAMSEIAEGHVSAGIEALKQVERIGKGFLPVRRFGFDAAWSDTAFQGTWRALERKLPRVTAARESFRLEKGMIPEGITYDPVTRNTFVGSVTPGHIVRVDSAGAVSTWVKPGEWDQVLGLTVDAKRRRLFAVSTNAIAPGGRKITNQIVSWNLDSGAREQTFDVAAAAQLNDVIVATDGVLYTTDSQAGAVFRVRGTGVVDTVMAPGRLPGANGLTLSADAAALYVAHATGVARIELADGTLLPRIELPAGESLAAIDGLYADGATLIGVQNVTNPGRVIRIHLRPDGKGAERIETLLSHHHPAIEEPTTGVLIGRRFALLATTQVARFTPEGKVESPETLAPPVVLSIELDGRKRD